LKENGFKIQDDDQTSTMPSEPDRGDNSKGVKNIMIEKV
jgi:hypothetical protein